LTRIKKKIFVGIFIYRSCSINAGVCVCRSVSSHNSKTTQQNLTVYFYAYCLWPLLGPLVTALRYVMYFRFYGWRHGHAIKHAVMFIRSSPLGGPLAGMQCCCPGSQEHVTWAELGCASRLGRRLSAYVSGQRLWLAKLCGGLCLAEVCHSDVKLLQCLVQNVAPGVRDRGEVCYLWLPYI